MAGRRNRSDKRSRTRRTERTPRGRRVRLIILTFFLAIFAGVFAGAAAGYLGSAPTLDQVQFDPDATTFIYDVNGEVIARLYRENRIPVRLDQIPISLQHAVIAVEDSRFYEHHGIDPVGIARALVINVREWRFAEGASTITQQLAEITFLTHDKSIATKLREWLWAIQIERKYSKEEILEAYLNQIYYGHGANGIQVAAHTFFGKDVSELDLAESAMLAGIPNGPAYYSPYIDMEAAKRRQAHVLDRMVDVGYISEAQAAAAKEAPIQLAGEAPIRQQNQAPYFVSYVIQQLSDRFTENELYAGGLHVYTTLDLNMQTAAQEALEAWLPTGSTDENGLTQPQGAIVALDPMTGAIRAMVAGRGQAYFNRAVSAVRQPGSAMKPFVFAAAIDSGYTPATIIEDEPIEFELPDERLWSPQNFDQEFRGPVTLRDALEDSINVVAVKLLDEVGVSTAISYTERMGIDTLVKRGDPNDVNLALALGGLTNGVTPLEMADAYSVLANGGYLVEPFAVTRIANSNDVVIEQTEPVRAKVLDETTAYIMTDMMRGVIARGTGVGADFGRPAAGKTGTGQENTNAWFVGYTPQLSAAAWIGNDRQSEEMAVGSGQAARMWRSFMRGAMADMPVKDFERPDGITSGIVIDTKTGLLAGDTCGLPADEVREEIFIAGTEPTEQSPRCRRGLFWWLNPSTWGLPSADGPAGAEQAPADGQPDGAAPDGMPFSPFEPGASPDGATPSGDNADTFPQPWPGAEGPTGAPSADDPNGAGAAANGEGGQGAGANPDGAEDGGAGAPSAPDDAGETGDTAGSVLRDLLRGILDG